MQRTLTRFLLLTCAGLLMAQAAGCGSNQGCVDYARSICARQAECSALSGKLNAANVEACITSVSRNCELSTKVPDSNWRQESATACGQAWSTASCEAVLSGPPPSACIVAGNRAVGAACADSYQCQSHFCNRPTSRDCGTCASVRAEGETCGGGNLCDYGLQCVGGTCAKWRTQGEVCDASFRCADTWACSNGTCTAPSIGQTCAGTNDYCSIDALQGCDVRTATCQPISYSVNQVGDSCGFDALTGSFVDCQPAAYCRTSGQQNFGVCALLPKEGEACAVVNASGGAVYQLCLPPTTCISGTCRIFDRASCG